MNCWQDKYSRALLGAKTKLAISDALARIVRELGFDYFSFCFRTPLPITRPLITVIDNYPKEWAERYKELNYIEIDPTLQHAQHSAVPLVWSEAISPATAIFWQDASDHGLKTGWAQACHGPGGTFGLLNMARSDRILNHGALREHAYKNAWLTHIVNQSMSNFVKSRALCHSDADLTSREVEVLRWTADGKTSSEVGRIMDISERTVNFHVGNVLTKLSVTNKTSAVIKSALLGLLEPLTNEFEVSHWNG